MLLSSAANDSILPPGPDGNPAPQHVKAGRERAFLTTNLNEEKAANIKLNTVALRKGVNATASTAA
jgi:hypothetical protein